MAILRPCRKPGCHALHKNPGPYCDQHEDESKRYSKDNRKSASERGYDWEWKKFRDDFLDRHPFCECARCKKTGRLNVAEMVHHVLPVETHPHLKLDESNCMAMSRQCHEVEHKRARDTYHEQWLRDGNRNQTISR